MKMRNAILICSCIVLFLPSLLRAQQNGQLKARVIPDTGDSYMISSPPTPAISADLPAADPASPPLPQVGTAQGVTRGDDQWHLSVSPYLWLPGVHGTVGAFAKDASFRASPSDLLSHFRFGALGVVEARRNRVLTTIDMMYMRLGDDKAVPFPALGEPIANFTASYVHSHSKARHTLARREKVQG
jgi:hypothetical protein